MFLPVPEENLFGIIAGVNVNISYNIGIALHVNYLLNNPEIQEKNLFINTQIDPVGYGFSATFRF
jgi:outer membrane protein W